MTTYRKRSAKEWIKKLSMTRHPEGGWFKETYRSTEYIGKEHLPERFSGKRSFSTAIYFLLQSAEFSAFHRIKQDEIWHFHDGASLTIYVIDEKDQYIELHLGLDENEQPQHCVKAGWLFAAEVNRPEAYTLVSCTVAPGFDFADFEMPDRKHLQKMYPQHKKVIAKFTKE